MSDILNNSPEKKEEKEKLIDVTEGESAGEKAKKSFKSFLSVFRIHKSSGKKAPFRANPKIIFAILGVVCAALIVLTAIDTKFSRPFKDAASFIIVPAQSGINAFGTAISDKLYELKSMQELADENKELKARIKELELENSILSREDEDIDRYKKLLDIKNIYSKFETTAAQVVSKDSSNWFATFIINKGSAEGIKQNMNVISEKGLVGIVSDVSLHHSTVRSLIDDDSSVSACFKGTDNICIVKGNLTLMRDGMIEFSDVSAAADIEIGDEIVTSKVSSVYLPGIMIGYVSDYQTDGSELTKSGLITPAVNFEEISEVLVITELKEDYSESESEETEQSEEETPEQESEEP